MLAIILIATVGMVQCEMFPYKEYFGLGDQPDMHLQYMMELFYLCSSPTKVDLQCECSKNCMKFRSCCIDAFWESGRNETLPQYINRFLLEADEYPDMNLKCSPIIKGLPEDRGYRVENILMKADCSDAATSQSIKDECTTEKGRQSIRPVLGSDGYIYKNKYCAMCSRTNKNFQWLNIEQKDCQVDPKYNNSKSFLKRNTDCKFLLEKLSDQKENKFMRRCNLKSSQEKSFQCSKGTEECRLCSTYVSGLQDASKKKCYKNFHCFMSERNENSLKSIDKTLSECPNFLIHDRQSTLQLTYSVTEASKYSNLVSFNDLSGKDCNTGEVYDDVTETCINDVICGPGYTQKSYTCVKNKKDVKDYNSECLIKDVYVSFSIATANEAENLTKLMKNQIPDLTILHGGHKSITFRTLNFSTETFINSDLRDHAFKIVQSSSKHYEGNTIHGMEFSRQFPNFKLCAIPDVRQNPELNFSRTCSVNYNNLTLPSGSYIVNKIQNDSRNWVELVLCTKFHLRSNCLKRKVEEYKFLSDQSISSDGRIYQPEEYLPLDTGVYVCVSNPVVGKVGRWERVVYGVEHYITIVGCVLSIIGYIWVILTYSIIPALKTIPGKNIVCLCISLLCCDIVMLASIKDHDFGACATLGILLHYFALSAQFWAGIVAFDIWSTFHRRSIRGGKTEKRFNFYLVIGFLFPLIVVITSIALEYTNKVDFGYGLQNICWVSKFYPRLVTYIIPMAVLTVLNIIALSYSIYTIQQHVQKSKKLLKKSGGEEMSLARMSFKLIVLLGAIEILGLIQIPGDSQDEKIANGIFRVIYTISRAFRGVFVWILYIVTDRVVNVYKDIRREGSLYTKSSSISYSSSRRSTRWTSVKNNNNDRLEESTLRPVPV